MIAVSHIGCPGCGQRSLIAMQHRRYIVTRAGMLCGCVSCGWRGAARLRQRGTDIWMEWYAMAPVDLTGVPRATPSTQVPDAASDAASASAPEWREIYQSGDAPDGVCWAV